MPTSPVLRVEDLHVSISRTPLLHGVSLTLAPGERVALVGRSGSGKSLTAAAIAGTLPATATVSGVVAVDGSPSRRSVALVGQSSLFALNPLVPVGRQLARPWRARGQGRAATRERVAGAMAAVGLTADLAARLPGELSGGQRQRVCIALAVATGAPVLVADEPTTALDTLNQRLVLDAFAAVSASLLLITHDVAVAAEVCDRVLVMAEGRVVEDLVVADLIAGRGGQEASALVADLRAPAEAS